MKDIAIYGAGGLGREVACLIRRINEVEPTWNVIGFFDDGKPSGSDVGKFGKILGGIEELNNWPSPLAVALCFGSPTTLSTVFEKIKNPKIFYPNLIHPDVTFADKESFSIGKGNIISLGCHFSIAISIGDFNLLNGFIIIGHDCNIGSFNIVMPDAKISGEVSLGYHNLIGTGAFIKQQIKIGTDVHLSPLSSLLKNPKDGNLYIGNPAKLFKF